jgi:hypothetical protein
MNDFRTQEADARSRRERFRWLAYPCGRIKEDLCAALQRVGRMPTTNAACSPQAAFLFVRETRGSCPGFTSRGKSVVFPRSRVAASRLRAGTSMCRSRKPIEREVRFVVIFAAERGGVRA